MSEAKHKFDRTIKRCINLIRCYQTTNENEKIIINKDLLRSAIVLAVAAIDSYVTDIFSEYFIIYIKNYEITEDLAEFIGKIGYTYKKSIESLKLENPYCIIKTLLDQHLEKYTTQKFEIINNLFSYYGLSNIVENSAAMSKDETVLKTVSQMINRRHKIVHDGDYKNGIINDVDEDKTVLMIQKSQELINCMEKIISNKFEKYLEK